MMEGVQVTETVRGVSCSASDELLSQVYAIHSLTL